jgi:hypothetical protein
MYVLYIDDSGSVKNTSEDYFVLGGVAVPEYRIRWLSYELDCLAEKVNPDNPRSVEFHASEIYNGAGVWGKYASRDDRRKMIKDVLLTLNGASPEIVIFSCAIHKKSYPALDAVKMAYEDISSRFDLMLQRISSDHRHSGMIVFDNSSYEQSLQGLTSDFRKSGNKWGNQLRNICEVPMFIDSRSSRIIQLADHIAYAVFRRYNANDLNYFNCIESRFDQSDGVIHGLAHKQLVTKSCTCPACLTRR